MINKDVKESIMPMRRKRVSSGIAGLDKLLSGLYIGDNVILYDDAGSLDSAFYMKFIKESQKQKSKAEFILLLPA